MCVGFSKNGSNLVGDNKKDPFKNQSPFSRVNNFGVSAPPLSENPSTFV